MPLSLPSAFRFDAGAAWLPRVATLLLFVALCALATRWALTFSAMDTIPVPKTARVAQTEAVETGAIATLFGGSPQAGVRDVQLLGVIADPAGGGAAVVSIDNGPPKALRAGAALSPQIRLVEIRDRAVVIERNGARQTIALPARPLAARGTPPRATPAPLATPPSGAAAPLSTPATQPVPAAPSAPPPAPPAAVAPPAYQPPPAMAPNPGMAGQVPPPQVNPGTNPGINPGMNPAVNPGINPGMNPGMNQGDDAAMMSKG
ncbi:type II secretion system protein N [Cupriavidus gilardii]|nr:type II secretion system protein N [Cupriavidus gilardii]MCD9124136.1 general secretion pathway protein [Cupriavidus sp. UGS-1]